MPQGGGEGASGHTARPAEVEVTKAEGGDAHIVHQRRQEQCQVRLGPAVRTAAAQVHAHRAATSGRAVGVTRACARPRARSGGCSGGGCSGGGRGGGRGGGGGRGSSGRGSGRGGRVRDQEGRRAKCNRSRVAAATVGACPHTAPICDGQQGGDELPTMGHEPNAISGKVGCRWWDASGWM